MDANAMLQEIREMVAEVLAGKGSPSTQKTPQQLAEGRLLELAGAVEKLDGHMSQGGDKPDAWKETEDHR